MANITVSVQSFLNAGITRSITIDNGSNIAALKTAMSSADGTSIDIMEFFFNGTKITTGTLASYGIVSGSYINSSNTISELATKELKQKAKLDLAAAKRAYNLNPRATYDITQLPTQYDDDGIIDNLNVGGLVEGRPWVEI